MMRTIGTIQPRLQSNWKILCSEPMAPKELPRCRESERDDVVKAGVVPLKAANDEDIPRGRSHQHTDESTIDICASIATPRTSVHCTALMAH